MANYLLNSAVITAPGMYVYKLLTVEEAVKLFYSMACKGEWISTIGYQETAEALGQLLGGVEIPVDRKTIQMAPGDQALVFRLVLPPGTPRIDPQDKGRIREVVTNGWWELGWLTRLA